MRNLNKGYSLFEVLIAFAIMAMVLTALVPGQAKMLARASDADARSLAFDLALSRVAHLGVSKPLVLGETTSQQDTWNVIEQVTPANGAQLDIQIRVVAESGKVLAEVTTTRALP